MITTIQLNEDVKRALDRLKSDKEKTYEDVILNLMKFVEENKKKQEQLLIEECREMYDDMLKISKEWEGTLMDGLDKNERWKELEKGM